ncbi:hypothetical protein [Hymenobacter swuensis]|uniref:hypothetical protein n=1 Tax=Hymenobacter swuensis TaxID=1446467 RepID=UPI0005C7846E|nr:hypothetical protein [Hymenobacter swuensis]
MLPKTQEANTFLHKVLHKAFVESFGLSHQFFFLEFRDEAGEDHLLNIDTEVTSNYEWDESWGLTEEERVLVLFNKVNLKYLTYIACDDETNLVLRFENGIVVRLNGSTAHGYPEPWTLGNSPSQRPGGYTLRAFSGDTYSISQYSA